MFRLRIIFQLHTLIWGAECRYVLPQKVFEINDEMHIQQILIRVYIVNVAFNSFFSGSDFCHLPFTFTKRSNPDREQQYIGPDLDPTL